MEKFQLQCKLCAKPIGQNFKPINDVIKEVFDVLLLKLRFDKEIHYGICNNCFPKLLDAFNFKSTCLYTDDTIVPYSYLRASKPVDLKKVYQKEKGCKNGNTMLKDLQICRLCFQPMSCTREVPVDIVRIFIPEINFKMTTNPAICIKCFDLLHEHTHFINSCIETEEKTNTNETFSNLPAKTEEIEIKYEEIDEEIIENIYNKIKSEENEGGYTSHGNGLTQTNKRRRRNHSKLQVYKCDESDYKRKWKNNLRQHPLTHEDVPEVYKCKHCTYESKKKSRIVRHQLCHKNPDQVRMYKCDKCSFESKYHASIGRHDLIHKDPSEVKMYKCGKCTFQSKKKDCLMSHQKTHEDPSAVQMYGCYKCKFQTKYKACLVKHQFTHVDRSKMIKCHKCKFRCASKASLDRHELKHKDPCQVTWHKCNECDYKNHDKYKLKMHLLKHKDPSQVEIYKCAECGYETRFRNRLIAHMFIHKDPSQVKMYKCDRCKFQTKYKDYIAKHQLRHKDASKVPI